MVLSTLGSCRMWDPCLKGLGARALVVAGVVGRGQKWWGMLGDLRRKDPLKVAGLRNSEGVKGEGGTQSACGENDQTRVLTVQAPVS